MSSNPEIASLQTRLKFARLASYLGVLALCARLWYLQGLHGSYYRDLSENNRIRTIRTEAPRGSVYDREGKVLVRNRPSFEIALMLEDTPDVGETLKRLAEITGRDEARLRAVYEARRKGGRPFEPMVVMQDITREELAKVKVNSHNLPGVIATTLPTRTYPNGSVAAQLFGYTREISKTQLEALRDEGYQLGDVVGQSGLEKVLEPVLKGDPGYVRVEVDARGSRKGELGIVNDHPGDDVYLSVDIDLQREAEQALEGHRGAVVALDPRNGEVLVLASAPSFDANIFSGQMSASDWDGLINNRNRPLMNRAIASAYPPGSTFKLLWGVAGLAEHVIDEHTEFYCPGFYMFAGRRYHCHKRGGHGRVNLDRAITLSCNAYFYQLGQALKIGRLHKYMKLFGIGQPTNIGLPGEEVGTLPSQQWKLQRFGERWYPGDTLPVSIGQGYVIVTPLQLANMTAAIANGGTLYQPLLVKKVVNAETGEEQIFEPNPIRKINLDKPAFDLVRKFSTNVIHDARGTGKRALLPGITMGGKTGTAQVGALGKERLGERFKDHAWFVAFAPAEEPSIAIAVLVENSGHGGEFAAPVARRVMAVHFRKLGLLQEDPPAPAPHDGTQEAVPQPETVQSAQAPEAVTEPPPAGEPARG